MLRSQHQYEDEEGTQKSVRQEQPPRQTVSLDAVQVIRCKNRQRWDGGQYVSRKLRSRKGEEHNWKECPEHQKLREGVSGAGVTQISLRIVPDLPLCDRDLNGVDQRAN